ncbi:MAG: diacylglycerol/lipid kinase family protein [Chloroflexota bacterium]
MEAKRKANLPPAVLVVNTQSRRGADLFREAQRRLERCDIDLRASYPVKNQRELLWAVGRAVRDPQTGMVIVGGGDGTISTVADAIAYRPITLGVLPLGTGNDFTRAMGIPTDLEGACEVLQSGETRAIQLGRINQRYFLNTTLIGFPAHVNHAVPNWLKRIAGKTAYALAAGFVALRPQPFRVRIVVDGRAHALVTSLVVVGNGRFHAFGQEDAETRSDRLVVQVPRDGHRATMLRVAAEYALKKKLNTSLLLTMAGREVAIEADGEEIDIDGEFAGWAPVTCTMAPGALRVVVPASAERAATLARLAA